MAEPTTKFGRWRRDWSTYRRLIGYARPYATRLTVGAVFCVLFAGSSLGMLSALKRVLKEVFNPLERSMHETLVVAGLLMLFGLLRGLGFYVGRYLIEWVGNRVVMDLRIAIFDRLQMLSLQYFSRSRTGELISRTSNDTSLVERAVAQVLSDVFMQPVVFIGAAGYLFFLDPALATINLVVFPVCIVPIAIFGRRVRRAAREAQQRLADLVSILQETITGVRIVKAFGMEDYERGRFNRQSHSVFRRIMQVTRARVATEPLVFELAIVGISMVLIYARWRGMTIDQFFTFAAALVMMYDPVKKLGNINMVIQHSSAAADRVFEVIDTVVTVKDAPDAATFAPPVRSVRFEDVRFAYDHQPVLNGITLEVPAGMRLAIVGGSGSGKTTLVSLIPRFFDVTGGQILLNGLDLRSLSMQSLRAQMGLVTQDTVLFNDTIANNIAYGSSDVTRERIEDAARRAHAHAFILQQQEGYETMIGERGVRLSGGQCQRLAIARAVLRNPPILLLDEATSALDTESERQVQAALDELMEHRTVFVIAHRLSTIMRADRIIVLDRGTIVESGTHDQLMTQGGTYKRLYNLQFEK